MPIVYRDNDGDLKHLEGKTIAVIGYGNQGRAQALNLRDSGATVIVGNIHDSYREQALKDGQNVMDIEEATKKADVVMVLLPDEVQPLIYETSIGPNLRPRTTISFGSGYTIRFKTIVPPKDTDVVMLAPRDLGMKVRESFVSGHGVTADVAIEQDFTGSAHNVLLALAKGIGCTRAGALESSFIEETDLDLFSEQALWPAMMDCLYISFEVLVAKGYSPEAVVLELYASRETADIFLEMALKGISDELKYHSPTAQYGYLTRRKGIAGEEMRTKMESILEGIRNGSFAREFAAEAAAGYPKLEALRKEADAHPMVAAEQSLIGMLSPSSGKN
jgi:ketol-acid reductoisomerase